MDLIQDRLRGIAVGAVVGDALGMALEFQPARPVYNLLTEMEDGALPAGSFTDDTEMALALAESLLDRPTLDPADLISRFMDWFHSGPSDIGIHTSQVLTRVDTGKAWQTAAQRVQELDPENASNGSLMRAWPLTIARWQQPQLLVEESRLQSKLTHTHPDCLDACALVNHTIYGLIHRPQELPPDSAVREAVEDALEKVKPADDFHLLVDLASIRTRETLANTGWVRHTVEAALWAVLTTQSFEEALVQVVNLGNDADTTGSVTGAIAGALYGYRAIPNRWKNALRGEYPLGSSRLWSVTDLVTLADRLAGFPPGD